jgi:hypothetical protein
VEFYLYPALRLVLFNCGCFELISCGAPESCIVVSLLKSIVEALL